ncbi:MAG TPA: hypothetical protein VMJ64_05415 [Anaerolineales bacterium]|nr:hypothetical protein [Anaerolineales bacterium]
MTLLRKLMYPTLVVLTGLLSLSGLAGGIGLLFNLNAPPVEQLGNSVFKDYAVPGLSLFFLVGGSALLATVLLVRKSRYGALSANTAGVIIMFFEFVEVLVIGSPAGVARSLQIIYFGLGTLISVFATGIWFIDLRLQK